jgi:tetratricopeptide (TPR) repeat protein
LHQIGKLNEAETLCRNFLSSNAKHFAALTLLGTIHLQRGNREEGIRFIELSLGINPNQPGALNNQGSALHSLKRHEQALASYNKAIAFDPNYAEAYNNRGNLLNELKRYDEALANCDRAIALKPRQAEAHNNRGIALCGLKRYKEALTSCNRAIALNSGYAKAYNNRGNILNCLEQYEAALASCNQALELNPNYPEAYYNRGIALSNLNRHDETLASYDRAIAFQPAYAKAYNNRGITLSNLKRYDEALASYDRSIALNPGQTEANLNKGYLKILLGEYEEGWKLHEWRWNHEDITKSPRKYPKPLWLGQEDLAGKTILLHSEQGLGDSLQFCRYAPMTEALGAKVLLETQQPLVSLLSTLGESIHIIAAGDPLPEFDYQCPLMSLPLAFKTRLDTIPAKIPYLKADLHKQKQWQDRMGAKNRPRIGLAWSGRKEHLNDHNRSVPLDVLAPLLDLDFEFHCLQKDIRPTDRELLGKYPQIRLYEENLKDFSDTAALLSEMNLVISVDTSIVHLAGALGKPVWILLPFAPDYRWLTEREDSPWYPTARLFRQPRIGDWTSVIAKIAATSKYPEAW